MVIANLNRAAPRLARVVGAVQRAPALATIGAPARSQVMVDAQQQREELLVIQEGMAHCDGLRSWSKGDSPTAIVCSSSLREIFYRPSPNLIKSRASDISIRARAHSCCAIADRELQALVSEYETAMPSLAAELRHVMSNKKTPATSSDGGFD
jgi:hypothetical protein